MAPLLRADETYLIRGAAFEVHTQLGPGHAEEAYEEALKIALRKRGVAVLDQVPFDVVYEDVRVGSYRPDLLANETILLELKAVERLLPIHEAQLLSYLRVTALELGLLINFGAARAQVERRVLTQAGATGPAPERNVPYAGGLDGLPHPELLWRIGNCVRRVHFTLGPGFLFHVYERALFVEMGLQGLPREPVKHVPLEFDGQTIGRERVHFLVADGRTLVVPVALNRIETLNLQTTRTHMSTLGLDAAVIANFHGMGPEMRVVQPRGRRYHG